MEYNLSFKALNICKDKNTNYFNSCATVVHMCNIHFCICLSDNRSCYNLRIY